jgi:hypothetical protein
VGAGVGFRKSPASTVARVGFRNGPTTEDGSPLWRRP